MDFALPVRQNAGKIWQTCPIDKAAQQRYNDGHKQKNHTKTRKRRVGFWHCLNQRAPMVETGGEQEAEHGLRVAPARGGCPKPAPGTPVTASGCKQRRCRSRQGPRREAAPGKNRVVPRRIFAPGCKDRSRGRFAFSGAAAKAFPSGGKPNPRGRKRNLRKRPARKSSHLSNHLQ